MSIRKIAAATLLSLIVLGSTAKLGAQGPSRIQWLDNLGQARQLAAQHQKLILLHFWSTDCAPCMRLERNVFNRPEVIRAINNGYIPVKVNAAVQRDLVARHRVRGWPTDIFLTADGREIFRDVSKQDPNLYVSLLDRVAANARVGQMVPAVADYVPRQNQSQQVNNPQLAQRPANGTNGPTSNSSPFRQGPGTNSQPQLNRFADNRGGDNRFVKSSLPPPPNSQANHFGGPASQSNFDRNNAYHPAQNQGPSTSYQDRYGSPYNQANNRNQYAGQPGMAAGLNPRYGDQQTQGSVYDVPDARQSTRRPAAPPQSIINPHLAEAPTGTPAQTQPAQTQPRGPAAAAAPKRFPLGMDGYCPVALAGMNNAAPKWKKGDVNFGAIHRGRTYLFCCENCQRQFLADPDRYAPVLSGYDPVIYLEQNKLVAGKRRFGLGYGPHVFLFVDAESRRAFERNPKPYQAAVLRMMKEEK